MFLAPTRHLRSKEKQTDRQVEVLIRNKYDCLLRYVRDVMRCDAV